MPVQDLIRVLVAAPYPTVRAGLAAIVEAAPGCAVAGEAANVEQLTARAEALAPNVVLLDPGDDPDAWLEGLLPVADARALPPILLLAGQPSIADEALHAGVRGLLLRDATGEEIGAALRAVAAGMVVLDRRVADIVIEPDRAPRPFAPGDELVEPLTPREREVLQLIARGLPNKAIAAELGISEHTVKFHVGSILTKLNAASRSEALARAAHLGLIAL